MRLSAYLPPILALLVALGLCVAGAVFLVDLIERRTSYEVERALVSDGHGWTEVAVDGLQVQLTGTAPSEATRFRALSVVGGVVDSARVIDGMDVAPSMELAPPAFAVEILRNAEGISLIGLIPASTDRAELLETIHDANPGTEISDLLETANFPAPEGWPAAMEFARLALARLPRSKISVAADRVRIIAAASSPEEKARLETELSRLAPLSLSLALDISAPRPVISPFTLRFLIDDEGARFDACAAGTPEGRDRILRAAVAAGLSGKATCPLGLGSPSPRWAEAVATGIAALAEIGGGSLTFSDADITLVAAEDTPQEIFDREVGELQAALPDVFSLHAVLPEPVKIDGSGDGNVGPPEFVATLSPEGLVQLRGRLPDEAVRTATRSFAMARFGAGVVHDATRVAEALPESWPTRVLAGLDALAQMHQGVVVVQPDFLELRGVTGNPEARAEVSRLLSEKLGEAANFRLGVTYNKTLDPNAAPPSPAECQARIGAVLSRRQITFEPGSDEIDSAAQGTLDEIAEILRRCGEIRMEVAGHTDSQGRESMNQQLSQARAEAVLDALMERRVLTSGLVARGYGESRPIADNDTEEGREANRRIEFTLPVDDEETATAAPGEAQGSSEQPDE